MVSTEWTERMYAVHGAVHHLDVPWGGALYRGSCWRACCRSTSRSGRRHGLPARHGRGFDELPAAATAAAAQALTGTLNREGLNRALAATVRALLDELERADPALAGRLAGPLHELGDA